MKMSRIKTDSYDKMDMPMISRPRIHLSFKDLPAAKEWQNGKKYNVMVEAEQVASDKHGITLEIHKVGGESKGVKG